MRYYFNIPFITAMLISTLSFAVEDTVKTTNLNKVVITANKTNINRNAIPLTVSVIDKDEIEMSGSSAVLPILSNLVPGLFITQKGVTGFGVSAGSAGAINIRGVGQGNKVLMLLDGQPQWAGVFGHSVPDLYVSSDIERVEIIRGPGSLLYGTNAMGGVINVITKRRAKEGFGGDARFTMGSYDTQKYMVNGGYGGENFSTFISFNHDRSNGHRANSDFKITNGFIKTDKRLGKNFNIIADLSVAKIFNQNPGKIDDLLLDNEMDILRGSASISLENKHKYGSGALKVYYNGGEHEVNDGYKPGQFPRDYLFYSKDYNTGVMLYENFKLLEGNTLTVGFDYKKWGGEAWNTSTTNGSRTYLVDREIHETAAYVIVQHDFFDRFTINGGMRFEYNSAFEGEWVPQVGAALRVLENSVIKASISKGYRSPTIREMYMFPPQNKDLMPENMINFELSAGHSMFDSRLTAELSVFYIDGWNMIETVRINGVPKNLNTGFFENRGFEFQAGYKIRRDLRTDFNYSYLATSKPLLASPKHKLYLSATCTPGDFLINLSTQYIGQMYINTATKQEESYTVANLRVSYKAKLLGFELRPFIHGDNITGTAYTINEGFPMPGVVILAGFDIKF